MIFGVNYQDILDVPSNSILGNNTGDISDSIALTPEQVRSILGLSQPFDATFDATLAVVENGFAYYGGIFQTGNWKINRFNVTTYQQSSATQSNNTSVDNLNNAWSQRGSLNYE